jgi:hypothetical protein
MRAGDRPERLALELMSTTGSGAELPARKGTLPVMGVLGKALCVPIPAAFVVITLARDHPGCGPDRSLRGL